MTDPLDPRPSTPILVLATWIAIARSNARTRRRNGRLVLVPLLAVAMVASVGIGSTSALLSDDVTVAGISVTGGTVQAPTAFAVGDGGASVQATWTAPVAGITPLQYEVFRRTASGTYPGTPHATTAASPWDDAAAADCETWVYRVRSRHTNLLSGFTPEQSIRLDRTPPTASGAHLFFHGPSQLVRDHVRVTPGGNVTVYAEVADNCDAQSSLAVRFQFAAPFNTTVDPTFSAEGWVPVGGGPRYHWRFDYALEAGAVGDGQAVTWNVLATDASGNAATIPATPFTGDGQGPDLARAELVSGVTDYYDSAYGIGEVNSNDTSIPAAVRSAGYHAYAQLSDPSGVASATVNSSELRTGATADPLAPGAFTAANGDTWNWKSADIVPNRDRTDQTMYTFTIASSDLLGNTATSGGQNVFVDDVRPAAASSSCQNFGTNNTSLAAPDYSHFVFQDTIVPGSLRAGWDGSTLTATAVLRNGTRDYFDPNGDFGINLFRGSAYNTAWNLNNTGWTTTNRSYPGSTFGFADRRTLRLAYVGGSTTAAPSVSAQASFGVASFQEASGNTPAGNFVELCTTSPW